MSRQSTKPLRTKCLQTTDLMRLLCLNEKRQKPKKQQRICEAMSPQKTHQRPKSTERVTTHCKVQPSCMELLHPRSARPCPGVLALDSEVSQQVPRAPPHTHTHACEMGSESVSHFPKTNPLRSTELIQTQTFLTPRQAAHWGLLAPCTGVRSHTSRNVVATCGPQLSRSQKKQSLHFIVKFNQCVQYTVISMCDDD